MLNNTLKLSSWFFTFITAWSFGLIYNLYLGGSMTWLRGMYENKKVMVDEIQSPHRLILVGGSGVHHSVDSQLLGKLLGMPVMNMGLDGNLGLNVIFPLILEKVRPGDMVLVIPEYLMLLDADGIGERSGPFTTAIGTPGLGDIPTKALAQDIWLLGVPTLRSVTKSTMNILYPEGKGVEYYSDPLTPLGDATHTHQRVGKWWSLIIDKPVTPHSLDIITKFRDQVKAKGATLVLSLPIIYGNSDAETTQNVSKSALELSKIAPTLYDSNYNVRHDPTMFADTQYHLQPRARTARSQQLAQELQPFVERLKNGQP